MSNLTPVSSFDDVFQLETNTPALGGPGGPMNFQAQALLNRTQYLAQEIATLAVTVPGLLDAIRAELANATNGAQGSGMLGHGATLAFSGSTIGSHLSEQISVTDSPYLADKTGAGVTTAALQAAVNAQPYHLIPKGSFVVGGVITPATVIHSKLEGNLLASVNGTTVFTLIADTSRARMKILSGGGHISGNAKTSVTGLRLGTVTGNPSPGAQEANLYLAIRDIQVSSCETGIYSVVTMEHSYDNVVVRANTTGMKLESDVTNGGANANSFRAFRAQSNVLGVLIKNNGALPVENNVFDGCLFQTNSLCGFATYSTSGAIAGIAIRNFHVESNGLGIPATAVIDGVTYKRSDFHFRNTSATLSDSDIASNLSPMVLAESNSVIHAENLTGYGNPTGIVYQVDATSVVYESGLAVTTGVKYIESYGFMPAIGNMAVIGAPLLNIGVLYQNDSTMANPAIPTLDNVAGVVAVTNEWKAGLGVVSSVQFAASVGSTGTNRNYWYGGNGTAGEFCFLSVILVSNLDTTLTVYSEFTGVHKTFSFALKANKPRRLIVTGTQPAGTTGLGMYLFPADAVGATISFKGHQYLHRTDMSVISAAYHDGHCGVKTMEYERCSPLPTTSGIPNGYRIYKPTRVAGGSPGDENVALSGAPNWKALPALAA